MDGITISTDRINAAGTGVGDVGMMLVREIGTMHDLLAQIRSGWQSDTAAPQFASVMHGYLDQATQLKDALLGHGVALAAAGRRFGEAEHSLAQSLTGHRR